jgi:hypothetical protein
MIYMYIGWIPSTTVYIQENLLICIWQTGKTFNRLFDGSI